MTHGRPRPVEVSREGRGGFNLRGGFRKIAEKDIGGALSPSRKLSGKRRSVEWRARMQRGV